MRLRVQGKITKWNDEKGFGFITPLAGGKPVFIHIKAIKRHHQRPQQGHVVYYSLSKDKQGRVCAADVSYAAKEHSSPRRKIQPIAACLLVALFFSALGTPTFVFHLIPRFIIIVYAAASAVTFIAYALDKSAAQAGRWRTAETTLHAMSILCGWPGALLAQQFLRHKSKKKKFQWVYKVTVVINIAATAWLLTPRGPELSMAFLEKLMRLIDA